MVIRVGIIDQHEIVRYGLQVFLETTGDLLCVGEASTPDEVISLCTQAHPQVLLYDFLEKGADLLSLILILHQRFPDSYIIVLTAEADPLEVSHCFDAGVAGYLTKQLSIDALAEAIRAVSQGTRVTDEQIAQALHKQGIELAGSWKIILS